MIHFYKEQVELAVKLVDPESVSLALNYFHNAT